MGKTNQIYGVRSHRLYKAKARSRITNGTRLLPNVDARSFWYRRFRDLYALYIGELGGDDVASEFEKSIARRVACLAVELERREMLSAQAGGFSDFALRDYARVSNTERRNLQALGLQRRQKPVPSLDEYLAQRAARADASPEVTDEG